MSDTLSAAEVKKLRDMMDRIEIRETIERYFIGDDEQNGEIIASVFTEDAEGIFDAGPTGEMRMTGGRVIGEAIGSAVSVAKALNHNISNVQIELDGDRAHTRTHCIARIAIGNEQPEIIQVRGLYYVDDLVRTPDGWRIKTRRHKTMWQYNALAVNPAVARHKV